MSFQDLLTYCKMKALEEVFHPTEESVWKAITRAYSEKFSVPLPQVRQMDPESVISEIFESKYEDLDVEEEIERLAEEIFTIADPNYSKQQSEEMNAFIKNVEAREKKRLGKMKEKEEKQTKGLRQQPPQPTRTGGFVDFSRLKDDK